MTHIVVFHGDRIKSGSIQVQEVAVIVVVVITVVVNDSIMLKTVTAYAIPMVPSIIHLTIIELGSQFWVMIDELFAGMVMTVHSKINHTLVLHAF